MRRARCIEWSMGEAGKHHPWSICPCRLPFAAHAWTSVGFLPTASSWDCHVFMSHLSAQLYGSISGILKDTLTLRCPQDPENLIFSLYSMAYILNQSIPYVSSKFEENLPSSFCVNWIIGKRFEYRLYLYKNKHGTDFLKGHFTITWAGRKAMSNPPQSFCSEVENEQLRAHLLILHRKRSSSIFLNARNVHL